MSQVNRGFEVSAEDAAKIMRAGLTGKNEDFINEIADSLIDRLIAKEPEVSELIASLVYRKLKSLDVNATIRSAIQRIADEEFQNNILGVVNARVCKLESDVRDIQSMVYGFMNDLSEVRSKCGTIVYKTNDWRGEDVRFTNTWSLSGLVERIDWIDTQLNNLKTEVERNEEERNKLEQQLKCNNSSTRDNDGKQ